MRVSGHTFTCNCGQEWGHGSDDPEYVPSTVNGCEECGQWTCTECAERGNKIWICPDCVADRAEVKYVA